MESATPRRLAVGLGIVEEGGLLRHDAEALHTQVEDALVRLAAAGLERGHHPVEVGADVSPFAGEGVAQRLLPHDRIRVGNHECTVMPRSGHSLFPATFPYFFP